MHVHICNSILNWLCQLDVVSCVLSYVDSINYRTYTTHLSLFIIIDL